MNTDLLAVVNALDSNVVKVQGGTLPLFGGDSNKPAYQRRTVKYMKTDFIDAFFSAANIDNIQKLLRFNVFKRTKVVIDNQSERELLNSMGYVYELHANHPPLLESANSQAEKSRIRTLYSAEIERLNGIVIDTILDQVITELKMQIYFLNDLSNPRLQEKPMYTSTAGERQYKSVIQTLTGTADDVLIS